MSAAGDDLEAGDIVAFDDFQTPFAGPGDSAKRYEMALRHRHRHAA
jgi:hypothetical protein